MHRIIKVKVLSHYRLDLMFADGHQGIADLSDMPKTGLFTLWNDYNEFKKVKIGDTGELIWGDQLDICPDALYLKVTGKSPEDVFPGLKHTLTYA